MELKKGMKSNKAWFQEWANEYDATLGKVKRHHKLLDLAVKASGIRTGDEVLDIGCGTGLLSMKFLARKNCTITAIDSSAQMIRIFQHKIKWLRLSRKIRCVLMPAENMRFPAGQFDIIAATVALHHVKDKKPVIGRICRFLKEGGRFVLGEIDMDTTGRLDDTRRLSRIVQYLQQEFTLAMKEGGLQAFERLYDNGKKHILNDGEYCIGFNQWARLCKNAGFRKVETTPLKGFEWFKVLVATK
jgi:ubiquinone/menaquinone biosynthesis C-methylase UbiE